MVIIGSRGSKLALAQSEMIREELANNFPDQKFEIKVIKTRGDKITHVPLAKVGGKGFFTKELEQALLGREVDLVVHSLKDLPVEDTSGLIIGAIPKRVDPRDVFLTPALRATPLHSMERGRIGTSSLRRKAQLHSLKPNCEIVDLRGNLDTRIMKLCEGQYDAIVVAAAGMQRLAAELMNWKIETENLSIEKMMPAPGQGALALQIRIDDQATARLVRVLHDEASAVTVAAERSLLHQLGGGCQIPVGAAAELKGETLTLKGLVISLNGKKRVALEMVRELKLNDKIAEAKELGQALAHDLLARGAKEILWAIRK